MAQCGAQAENGVSGEASPGAGVTGNSFDDFFVHVLPRTLRAARRLTGDPWLAEDVAVEALGKAYARWGRVQRLPWRDAWVLTVASREALHQVRHRPPEVATRLMRDESDDAALRVALAAALMQLPRRQQETIVLRYLCDLSESEVAEALGVSPGTVKTHIHRALTSLRIIIGTDFEEEYAHAFRA
ncbi:MAG: SigE family RNA polymerase sigma factor [Acidimicrobiales bacterium]|jgi:RNA polymerase sigma-70 factor (sigma-E family)